MKKESFLSLVFDADQLKTIRAIQKKYKIKKVSRLLRLVAENAAKAEVKRPAAKARQITFRVDGKTFGAVKKIAKESGNTFSQLFRILIEQTDRLLSEKALKNIAAAPAKAAKPAKKIKSVPAKKSVKTTKSVPAKTKKPAKKPAQRVPAKAAKPAKAKSVSAKAVKPVKKPAKRVPANKKAASKKRR